MTRPLQSTLAEIRVVRHRVEERVDGREAVELLALQLLEDGGQVARVRDQDVGSAHPHRQHDVRVEAEDVIDRQRADRHDLLAGGDLLQRRLVPRLGLQDVGDEVPVQQHRALADPGRAAGVLEHGDVVGPDLHRRRRLAPALRERVVEAHRAGQVERRHELLGLPHDVVDDQRLRKAEHVSHRREHDLLGRHRRDHLLQHAREVLEDDDRLGARVLQLVLELARRVERVDVDDHQPGAQDRGDRDRVLRHVRHHHRDAVALGESLGLQPAGERRRRAIDLAKGDRAPHELVRDAIGVAAEALVEQRDQRGVLVHVDLGRDAGGILLQPDLFHRVTLAASRSSGNSDGASQGRS